MFGTAPGGPGGPLRPVATPDGSLAQKVGTCKDANTEQSYVCIDLFLHANVNWGLSALAPIFPKVIIKTLMTPA